MKGPCKECEGFHWKSFHTDEAGGRVGIGECRRHSPQAIALNDGMAIRSYWPEVQSDNWCLEFRPADEVSSLD